MAEFVEGFEVMREVYPAVTIFRSSRLRPNSFAYKATEQFARMLVENVYTVINITKRTVVV